MKTLLLDRTTWDLVIDANGNIAVASDPYSLAQDAASSIQTNLSEVWYDTTRGVPYFGAILGQRPSVPFMKSKFAAAALLVPGVASAVCFITGITGRGLTGQVQITSAAGAVVPSAFSVPATPSPFFGV